jgi:hypothetical protein
VEGHDRADGILGWGIRGRGRRPVDPESLGRADGRAAGEVCGRGTGVLLTTIGRLTNLIVH